MKVGLVVFLVCFFQVCLAQPRYFPGVGDADPSRRLKIGDRVPDLTLLIGRNYSKSTVKLSSLKGKLIILDFWNRWCSSCIEAFPDMERLQDKFGTAIQIILVTTDNENDLAGLFQRSAILQQANLPMVFGDTILNKIFYHSSVPFHVWIDEEGNFIQAVSGWNTTESNIEKYLKYGSVEISQQNDVHNRAIIYQPILDQIFYSKRSAIDNLESYSFISRRNDIDSRTGWKFFLMDSSGRSFPGVSLLNDRIIGLLTFANCAPEGLLHIKAIVEPKDSANLIKYFAPIDGSEYGRWILENTYCYELKSPSYFSSLKNKQMLKRNCELAKHDIESHFGLTSSLENRIVECLVVKLKDKRKLNLGGGTNGVASIERTKNDELVISNSKMARLVSEIVDIWGDFNSIDEKPVIDNTQYAGLISGRIKIGGNLEEFNEELANIGLEIATEYRSVRCLVIKEL